MIPESLSCLWEESVEVLPCRVNLSSVLEIEQRLEKNWTKMDSEAGQEPSEKRLYVDVLRRMRKKGNIKEQKRRTFEIRFGVLS